MARLELDVGVLVAASPGADRDRLVAFAGALADEAREALERASGVAWRFHALESSRLPDDEPRRPSDFLDEASLRMVEGPFDAVVVVTDVGLVSRRQAVVAGLASRAARVAVLSTRRLLLGPRGTARTLASDEVRHNGAALLMHLLGHVLGLGHARDPDDVMAPYAYREGRHDHPPFGPRSARALAEAARRGRERELRGGGPARTLLFTLRAALAHPRDAFGPLLRSRAPLLPLRLPRLATAALAPTFILVFTAEIWDVGLNLRAGVAPGFAAVSVLAAAWYLARVQNLFFPRKEKRVLTEHMALVNVTVFLSLLLAMLGLFAMVMGLMVLVQLFVFPEGLIATWPTLQSPEVTPLDKARIAAFITTIGVLTGALAGGLESRAVVRHLALFDAEP